MRLKRLACATFVALLTPALAATAGADEAEDLVANQIAEAGKAAEATTSEKGPTGLEIYDRVLANRFNSFDQDLKMTSGDSGGNIEVVKMEVKYKSFRKESKKILSKTICRYEAPLDVRNMGYLIVNKLNGKDDQFVYRPSLRRTRRVNLRGESVVGTDFSLEDIIPRELEDASYNRLPDAELDGKKVYVVEVIPNANSDSEYSKFVAYVDKRTYVTLRTVYWNNRGVAFKELSADASSIIESVANEKNGARAVWYAKKSRVENMQLGTFTELDVERLVADPRLSGRDFTERRLSSGGH